MRTRKRMEPTMAPMTMLVTVIPEPEEERRGAKSVLNRCASLFSSITQARGNSQTTNSLRQHTAFSRRRAQGEEGEEGSGDKQAAVAPSAWLWRGAAGSYSGKHSNNIQKKRNEMSWSLGKRETGAGKTNKHNEKELKSDLKSLRQRYQPVKEWVWK